MDAKSNPLHLYTFCPPPSSPSLSCFAGFHTSDPGVFVRSIVVLEVVEKIRQNERFEGEGDCRLHEGEQEKKRGRERH